MRRFAISLFLIQGLVGGLWWAALLGWPAFRRWFIPPSFPDGALTAFSLPDVTLFVLGSLAAGYGLLERKPWAYPVVCFVSGGTVYAALYCLMVPVLHGGAGWAAGLGMLPSLVCCAVIVWGMRPVSGGPKRYGVRTLVQVVMFWSLWLFLVPCSLWGAEADLGLAEYRFTGTRAWGLVLFACGGALGLASAWAVATRGEGTPLPLDPPSRLVVSGPYGVVRNPMAVGGILQGVAVGLFWGSPLVIAYAVAGAILWHLFVRPLEERDLLAKFGDGYAKYRLRVRCWVPIPR